MTTRILRSADDIERLSAYLSLRTKFPLTVEITQGAAHTRAQQRLAHMWFADIARQRGDTPANTVRAECKLTLGAPIMCRDSEAFRASWAALIDPLPHETQVAAVEALDIPVTRLMKKPQMVEFMTDMEHHWSSGLGFRLTDPEALKYEEELGR